MCKFCKEKMNRYEIRQILLMRIANTNVCLHTHSVLLSFNMVSTTASLQTLVAQLRQELAAFDPAFFHELEDLKYNYQQAVELNTQYEQQLALLGHDVTQSQT